MLTALVCYLGSLITLFIDTSVHLVIHAAQWLTIRRVFKYGICTFCGYEAQCKLEDLILDAKLDFDFDVTHRYPF
jgi:hypothetical protein